MTTTHTLLAAEQGFTYPTKGDLAVQTCCACGILFAVDGDYDRRRREDHKDFHCPNGHPQHYTGKTEAQRQRQRAEQAEAKAARLQAHADQQAAEIGYQQRRASALKGHLTRMRRRIAAGVCPVPGCQRTGLTQTLRHIAAKHPDWLHDHPDVA